jgi:hypothetical protein
MNWSEEEIGGAENARAEAEERHYQQHGDSDDKWRAGVAAIMTHAAELLAARGGTMTAEALDVAIQELVDRAPSLSVDLDRHLSAQGARVAVLEAENTEARERLEKRTAELKAQRDEALRLLATRVAVLEQALKENDEEIKYVRERLTAAEEGSRELVRRAQGAEADVERWKREHSVMATQAKDAREEARVLKARCATLFAAGQTLSAVADRTGEPKENAPSVHAIDAYGLLKTGDSARHPQRYPHEFVDDGDGLCGWRREPHAVMCGYNKSQHMWPCSATCTHDDATKPGHPERVKERSEAVNAAVECPPSCPSHLNSGHTHQADDPSGEMHGDYADGYDAGAEAMRAACLTAATEWAMARGFSVPELRSLKSAIEGAVP